MAEKSAAASRWVGLDRPRARVLICLLAALLAVSMWASMPTNRNAAPVATADAAPAQQRNEDLVLYKAIADRVDAGQDYYAVAADELRRGNYPLKPFVTFRLPTLTFAASWLGPIGLLVVQWSLFAALMAAWWVRLEGQFDVDGRRLSAVMLAAAGIAVGLTGR